MDSGPEDGSRPPKRQASILSLPYYHKEYPKANYQPIKKAVPKEVKKPVQKKVAPDPPMDVTEVFRRADQLGYEVAEEDEDELGDEEFACSLLDRRLVDVPFFVGQLLQFRTHQGSRGKCNFHDMVVMTERRHGLNSCYSFQCKSCHTVEPVWTNRPRLRPVNREVVRGAVHHLDSDLGTLNKFLGSCGVPAVPEDIFLQEKGLLQTAPPAAKKQRTLEIDLSVVKQEPPDVGIEFESVCSVSKPEESVDDHLMIDNDRDFFAAPRQMTEEEPPPPVQVKKEHPVITNPSFLTPSEISFKKPPPPPPPVVEAPKVKKKNRQLSSTSFTFEGHNDPVPAVPEINLFAYHPELFSPPSSSYKPSGEVEIKTEKPDVYVKKEVLSPKRKRKPDRRIRHTIVAGKKDLRLGLKQPVSKPDASRLESKRPVSVLDVPGLENKRPVSVLDVPGLENKRPVSVSDVSGLENNRPVSVPDVPELENKRPVSESNNLNVRRKANGSAPMLQSEVGSKPNQQAENVAPSPVGSKANKQAPNDVPGKREKSSILLTEASTSQVVNFGSLSILPVAPTKDVPLQPIVPKSTSKTKDPALIKTIPPQLGPINIGSISICPITTTAPAQPILGSSMSIIPVVTSPSVSIHGAVTLSSTPSMSILPIATKDTTPSM